MEKELRTKARRIARLLVEDMNVGNPVEVNLEDFVRYEVMEGFVREGDFNFEVDGNIFEISYGIKQNGDVVYIGFLDEHKFLDYFDINRGVFVH